MGSCVNGFREGSLYFKSVEVLLPVAERTESAILRLNLASIGSLLCDLKLMPTYILLCRSRTKDCSAASLVEYTTF